MIPVLASGLARGYDAAGLKRKLRPVIAELEHKGYLRPMAEAERFRSLGAGQWQTVFEKAKGKAGRKERRPAPPTAEELSAALVKRGITPAMAHKTVARYLPAQIQVQMGVYDWLLARKDPRLARNPPGFLLCAIQGDYPPPAEFIRCQTEVKRDLEAAQRQCRRQGRKAQVAVRAEAQQREDQARIQQFWYSLSPEERKQCEQEILTRASRFQCTLIERGGTAGRAARQAMLDTYARKQLGANALGQNSVTG